MSSDEHPKVHIVTVPTEAGTHFPGQCKAPRFILKVGRLGEKLYSSGYNVEEDNSGVRNEENSLIVMEAVDHYFVRWRQDLCSTFPIILGGDCSITPAVFLGLCKLHPPDARIGLLYIDGDADLTLPAQTSAEGSSGILDSMTMTHLTGRRGGLESMRRFTISNGRPLINPDNVVLFGFDPLQPATEHWVYLVENGFKVYTRPTVQSDPVRCAQEALAWLRQRVDVVYVHFDVDVIDSGEFPLANYPHYAGVGVDEAMEVLDVVLSDNLVQGLTLTEVNPNNDPDGAMVNRLVDGIVHGMSKRPH